MCSLHVERVETVPDGASVVHYDELTGECKDRFPELVDGARDETLLGAGCELATGDLVKFTDYYRVTCR